MSLRPPGPPSAHGLGGHQGILDFQSYGNNLPPSESDGGECFRKFVDPPPHPIIPHPSHPNTPLGKILEGTRSLPPATLGLRKFNIMKGLLGPTASPSFPKFYSGQKTCFPRKGGCFPQLPPCFPRASPVLPPCSWPPPLPPKPTKNRQGTGQPWASDRPSN